MIGDGSDLVIGASWLATLGLHITNYIVGESYLKFYMEGNFITLQGTNGTVVTQARFHQLRRMIHTDAVKECFMLHLHKVEESQTISDWQEHLQHVEEVLRLLEMHQLLAKMSKCSFGRTKVEYLGHVILVLGVEMDPLKVVAVLQWLWP
ncbi:uncharacterized protein LOC114748927 [Neltuma alba]|uniref:uncharacterized protein LOC114748927 n=1 Tax=Neltuma alba TaxID=207710 RepID=UPI0010A3DFDD|nr:uncharacterized protein LOC114748927 [Prosopis alba]